MIIQAFSLFLSLAVLPIVTFAGVTPSKKTVCSATINSNEEIELFKKNLSAQDWNFIELTTQGSDSNDKNWLLKACEKKITCDVLIVSGHFGGTFFGSSQQTLSLNELEKNSCNQKCEGILKNPKEVFLFGCNTLASKEKDHRTPEQYMQVLLDDGFSANQASQIVSFRYSGFGDSFKSSMTQIFAATPRIYGFSSVGPSGKTIAPLLTKYLQSTKSEYHSFDAYTQKSATVHNEKLFSAMKNTSLAQAAGLIQNMKSVEEKPYCYIRSESISRLNRLIYVRNLFKTNRAISILSHVQYFLHQIKMDPNPLSQTEKDIMSDFSRDEKMKSELLRLLELKDDIYLPLKADVLNTLKDLDVVSNQFVEESFVKMIDLKTPFTEIRKNMLCSSQIKVDIPAINIPEARWSEPDFVNAILCLKPKDIEMQNRMGQLISSSKNTVIRGTAIWYFYWLKTVQIQHQTIIAKALLLDPDLTVRQSAAMVLRELKPAAKSVQRIMLESAMKEENEYVLAQISSAIKASEISQEDKIEYYLKTPPSKKEGIQKILF